MNLKNIIFFVLGVICVVMFGWMRSNYEHKLDISEQNLKAYKNDIKQLELKNGELIKIRDSYILEKNQLQEQFDLSKKEIKELEDKLQSAIIYISKIESNIYIDTIKCIQDSIIFVHDTIPNIYFKYKDKWLEFNGMTKYKTTELYNISMDVPLTIGLTNDYQLFVGSDNPYVNFSSIEGAAINNSKLVPKKQYWSGGIQCGVGFGYDLITSRLTLGPYFGIGMQYNF